MCEPDALLTTRQQRVDEANSELRELRRKTDMEGREELLARAWEVNELALQAPVYHRGLAWNYMEIGRIYNQFFADSSKALHYFYVALDIESVDQDEQDWWIACLEDITRVFWYLGDYPRALECTLKMSEKGLQGEVVEMQYYIHLAISYTLVANYSEAQSYLHKGELLFIDLESRVSNHQKVWWLNDVADTYKICQDFDKALHYANKVLQVLQGYPEEEKTTFWAYINAVSHLTKAEILLKTKEQLGEVKSILQMSWDILKSMDSVMPNQVDVLSAFCELHCLHGDFHAALGAIKAKTIVITCDNDLYFRPEDNELEIVHIPNGELRLFESAWGHCVASPGNSAENTTIKSGQRKQIRLASTAGASLSAVK